MFKRSIPTVVALVCGWLVLLGALLPITALIQIRIVLVHWAAILGAFALLLAALSVVGVHARRIQHGPNKLSSALIIVAIIGSFLLVFLQGPYSEQARYLLNYVLIPGESALLALTAVTLLLAGTRIFQTRRNWESIVFIVVVLITLMTTVPYIYPPVVHDIVQFITHTLATSGMRGLIIGVALGTLLTGFRILFGTDRPYSDE